MWQTFKKASISPHGAAVSVWRRGLSVNKAAVLMLTGELPDTNLDFVVLIDRERSKIGLRLYDPAERGVMDVFPGRRPRTGRMDSDGIRRLTNLWMISGAGFAAAAGLEIGRYTASLKGASIHPGPVMIVFGPKPLEPVLRCT